MGPLELSRENNFDEFKQFGSDDSLLESVSAPRSSLGVYA